MSARDVLDRAGRQRWMVTELRLLVSETPPLGLAPTEEQRIGWIRAVIERHRLADTRVKPSKPDTWAQLFERACEEAWA